MLDPTKTFKVLHVEDDVYNRMIVHKILTNGLRTCVVNGQTSVIEFSQMENPLPLQADLERAGIQHDIYLFDNDYNSSDPDMFQGAAMALKIKQLSAETGRPVIAVNLLCSNPEGVRRQFGRYLDEKQIPSFNKIFELPVCLFYVAACIRQGRQIPFDEWMKEQGMERLLEARDSQKEIIDRTNPWYNVMSEFGTNFQFGQVPENIFFDSDLLTCLRDERFVMSETYREVSRLIGPTIKAGKERM